MVQGTTSAVHCFKCEINKGKENHATRVKGIEVHAPTYQEARHRNCKSLSSLTGRGGNFLASLDGPEEFSHLSHFTFCAAITFVEAIIWSFSRVNSITAYKVQCLSI